MIEITGLHIYPVKSLKGIALDKTILNTKGLEFDRNWMVTDTNHNFLTQRQIPQMATIRVSLTPSTLILEHPSISPLIIALDKLAGAEKDVTVWKDQCLATDEGSDASQWLTEVLGRWNGRNLKLFKFSDNHIRSVNTKHLKGESAHTAFSDAFPFLVVSEASLDYLNEKLVSNGASKVTMDRFRPNIIIRGTAPFGEDTLDALSSSNHTYELGIRTPCQRCPITTTDQDTGERPEPKEPLQTLVKMNTQPTLKGAYFGKNATLIKGCGEIISIGDKLNAKILDESDIR